MTRVLRLVGTDDLSKCRAIREVVFIVEQHVSADEEWDGLDRDCLHFLAEVDDTPAGTARLLRVGGRAKAQRVAVLAEHRRRGIGRALMDDLEQAARELGHHEVYLGAQLQAVPFYQRLGYEVYGDEFLDARIPHRHMIKPLT